MSDVLAFPPELHTELQALERLSGVPVADSSAAFLVGSHAQGLAGPDSDRDYVLVYAPLGELGVPFSGLPEQRHSEDKSQKLYRIDKFAAMLDDGNADSVGVAFLPPTHVGSGAGAALIVSLCEAARPHLMTQQYVCNCAGHFASTYRELHRREGRRVTEGLEALTGQGVGKRARLDDKYLAHALRLGLHALHTERTGERLAEIPAAQLGRLRALKEGRTPFAEAHAWFEALASELLTEGARLDGEGDRVWLYDARRAAHLGRSEALRAAVRQVFRAAYQPREGT